MTDKALGTQVGGSHYTKMPLQPFQFTMANRWDPLAHTILKYVSRFRDKNGLQDLNKARHCVGLRTELLDDYQSHRLRIPAFEYIEVNKLSAHQGLVILSLEYWVHNPGTSGLLTTVAIDGLIREEYPEGPATMRLERDANGILNPVPVNTVGNWAWDGKPGPLQRAMEAPIGERSR